MVRIWPMGQHGHGETAQASSVPPEEIEQAGSLANNDVLDKEPSGLENGTKAGFFSRPWTPRRIAFFSLLGFLGLAMVALVIALPITLTRQHNGDTWKPSGTANEDSSYHVEENHPVWAVQNFPDPGLIQHNGTWYAFGTNPKKGNPDTIHIPVATSANFVNWTLHENYDAMPSVADWQQKVNTWAPDVIQRVSH